MRKRADLHIFIKLQNALTEEFSMIISLFFPIVSIEAVYTASNGVKRFEIYMIMIMIMIMMRMPKLVEYLRWNKT